MLTTRCASCGRPLVLCDAELLAEREFMAAHGIPLNCTIERLCEECDEEPEPGDWSLLWSGDIPNITIH